MSLPERILWNELRKKQTGLRFRRQHPAGSYVLDFYCHEARLCVEVDGESHDFRAAHDQARDLWLAAQGVRTVRVCARDVFRNLEGVLQYIALEAQPPSVALRATPPPEGWDKQPAFHRFISDPSTKPFFSLAFGTPS